MKTRADLILSIYESHRNGIIDDETKDTLLEACKESNECDEEDQNDEDEVVEFKKLIKNLKSKVEKAESKKTIENIKNKAKDSMEELSDVADDDAIEDKLEKLYDDFINSIDADDDVDSENNEDESEEKTVEEKVNEVIMSIYESYENGYISESTRDELILIVNENFRDAIRAAAEKGKKIYSNAKDFYSSDEMKSFYRDIDLEGRPGSPEGFLQTGKKIAELKERNQQQIERRQREEALKNAQRQKLNMAHANAGIGY